MCSISILFVPTCISFLHSPRDISYFLIKFIKINTLANFSRKLDKNELAHSNNESIAVMSYIVYANINILEDTRYNVAARQSIHCN